MSKKIKDDLDEALKLYSAAMPQYIQKKTVDNYCTFIRTIQSALSSSQKVDIIKDWITPNLDKPNALDILKTDFDTTFSGKANIGSYKTSVCKSAIISLGKFLFGQYNANLYLNIGNGLDDVACQLVAQNAIFCKVEIADKIKIGELGSRENRGKGNDYFSWYCCYYQRKPQQVQKKGQACSIPSGQPDPCGQGIYKLDDNTYANHAIKYAIIEGLPEFLKAKHTDFNDYMACHIWGTTCYNYLYHTSVFNIVLLPKSIAGLSDFNEAVMKLLQYEAARRFGVYPAAAYPLGQQPERPENYSNFDKFWRQQDEHALAQAKNITKFKAL